VHVPHDAAPEFNPALRESHDRFCSHACPDGNVLFSPRHFH
jgi:hypothetical protein